MIAYPKTRAEAEAYRYNRWGWKSKRICIRSGAVCG